MKPTHEEVTSLFNYNPLTGIVTRKSTVTSNAKEGSVVGWLNSDGYLHVKIRKTSYKLHRVIWLYVHGEWPKGVIDHINRDRKDNRLANLRDTTVQVNNINKPIRKDSKTGIPGVTFHPRDKTYYAACKRDGKQNYLGSFKTIEEATNAVNNFKAKYEIGRTL